MPIDPDRCARHQGAPVIATCDGCDEALCLTCAVPVRGRVLGPSCLAAELGPSAVPDVPAPPPTPDPLRRLVDLTLTAVLLSTVLPWSGAGLGASPFGAWGYDLRWASLAVAASLAGCAAAALAHLTRRRNARPADRAAAAAASAALAATVLAVVFPPSYTSPALGPWVALVAALGATATSVVALRREEVSP